MGKSFARRRNEDSDTVLVLLDEVYVPQKTWDRILRKDAGQVRNMRADYESGRGMVRVVLRPRFGGGYNVEDGRHRVIAAKLSGQAYIEAIVVGESA